MTYRTSYELEFATGFALLEQIEEAGGAQQFRYTPDHGDFEDMFFTGFYGGMVDPDESQDFYVYNLVWPDDLIEGDDEDLLEVLSSELDGLFPGWVLDKGEDKVYILRDPETPPPTT